MAWELIFRAPDTDEAVAMSIDTTAISPPPRKPVSMSLQLEPGAMIVVGVGTDDDDDDED